jgi:rhodanese-related sulfurtransferase
MDNIIPFIVEEIRSQGIASGLTPRELTQAINREEAVVVDIRDKEAFTRGHITSSMNIPSAEIEQNLNKLSKFKQKKIVVVCQLGRSCVAVSDKLRKSGFSDVTILKGGVAAWQASDMPLISEKNSNGKN